VNQEGIRVLTVYLGRTATPMQQAISQEEGRPYHPEALIQPEDVASVVENVLSVIVRLKSPTFLFVPWSTPRIGEPNDFVF
jgi:NAD(P)-dependent dehydrogenase (short-subunit alcohol dehydrogenase family)